MGPIESLRQQNITVWVRETLLEAQFHFHFTIDTTTRLLLLALPFLLALHNLCLFCCCSDRQEDVGPIA